VDQAYPGANSSKLEVMREARARFGPRHELGMYRAARAAIHAGSSDNKSEKDRKRPPILRHEARHR